MDCKNCKYKIMIDSASEELPENPYPEDIFIEPTSEKYDLINKTLEQCGVTPDGYNGSHARKVFNNLKEEVLPILAKYKLRVEMLELANRNANKLIEEEVNLKTGLLSQLSALQGKVDVGKIIKVMDSLKYKLFYQKPATLSLGEVLFDSDIQKLAQSLAEYFEEGE